MKLSDRIQALKFSAKYQSDYRKYDSYRTSKGILDFMIPPGSIKTDPLIVKLSPEAQKLCKKYKIPFLYPPDEEIVNLSTPSSVPNHQVIDLPSVLLEEPIGLKSGRYLRVIIDMSTSIDEILSSLSVLHKYWNPRAKGKQRHRETTLGHEGTSYSHWDIYKMIKIHGKKPLVIAQEIIGSSDNADNPRIKSMIERIRQAYKKAQKQIREAEK